MLTELVLSQVLPSLLKPFLGGCITGNVSYRQLIVAAKMLLELVAHADRDPSGDHEPCGVEVDAHAYKLAPRLDEETLAARPATTEAE